MRFQKRRVHFKRLEINYSGLAEGNFNCTRLAAAGAHTDVTAGVIVKVPGQLLAMGAAAGTWAAAQVDALLPNLCSTHSSVKAGTTQALSQKHSQSQILGLGVF
jgi:hypothetical protein